MPGEFEEKFVRPIVNACYPGTLAALSLAAISINASISDALKVVTLIATLLYTLAAFFIFFYTIYPTRKRLWTLTAVTFLSGLCCSIIAALILFSGLLS
jgi:hypothetical protein